MDMRQVPYGSWWHAAVINDTRLAVAVLCFANLVIAQ